MVGFKLAGWFKTCDNQHERRENESERVQQKAMSTKTHEANFLKRKTTRKPQPTSHIFCALHSLESTTELTEQRSGSGSKEEVVGGTVLHHDGRDMLWLKETSK